MAEVNEKNTFNDNMYDMMCDMSISYMDNIQECKAISIKGLCKKYSSFDALHNVNFAFPDKGIIGLLGDNGAGKTTLLKIIAGFIDINGGEINVFGKNPFNNLNISNEVVYSYHNYEYPNNLRLDKIIKLYEIGYKNFDKSFADNLLKYFELDEKAKYNSLSKGMASVFNFICAIACRTKIVLLDEPMLGMDVTVRKKMYDILVREYMENPRLFIVSGHLIKELESVITDIAIISNGKNIIQCEYNDLQQTVYCVSGDSSKVEEFCRDKKVIKYKKSELSLMAYIYGDITEELEGTISSAGIDGHAIGAEELVICLTDKDLDEKIDKLWE